MFITFEGIEGSGKGTAIEALRQHLELQGLPVLVTREPGGSDLGQDLRKLLLNTNSQISARAELFLYLADRAQHVNDVIHPALDAGQIVISDRYADSTIVYQGYGRELDVEELCLLNESAVAGLWPDLTILLDLDVTVGLRRARSRNADLGIEESEGRFEAESLAFHNRVRNGYLERARLYPERFCLIDSSRSVEDVKADIFKVIETTKLYRS